GSRPPPAIESWATARPSPLLLAGRGRPGGGRPVGDLVVDTHARLPRRDDRMPPRGVAYGVGGRQIREEQACGDDPATRLGCAPARDAPTRRSAGDRADAPRPVRAGVHAGAVGGTTLDRAAPDRRGRAGPAHPGLPA